MARATKLQQGKNGKLASKKSKTGDPKCSAAASAFARGQATSDTYKILGECRSRARMKGQANLQREAGNEAKAQVLEKRAERGMTGKDRLAKAKELVAARKAKIDARVQAKAAPAAQAKPSLREQAAKAREGKGDRIARLSALSDRAARKWNAADDRLSRAKSEVIAKVNAMSKEYGKTRDTARKAEIKSQANSLADSVVPLQARAKAAKGRMSAIDRELTDAKLTKAAQPRLKRLAKEVGIAREFAKSNYIPVGTQTRVDWITDPKDISLSQTGSVMAKTARDKSPVILTDGVWRRTVAPIRAAKAAELRAQRAAKSAPAKPDRLARLGATDPKVKAMLAERRSAKAAELRQQRAAKAAPAPAAARPSRSTPERQARVEAAKDRLFGRRLDRAFTKLEGPKGDNFQGLDKVRAALPYRSQEFESRLTAQRKQGRYSLASYEGTAGPMSDSLRAASIQNGTSILSYVSRRDAEPYTPRKAKAAPASPSLPAIKSGPPTTKGGVPAETPKRSLLEQASIRRAAKEAAAAMQGTTRAGQLAGRAKRKYDAARRNAAANIKKAKEQGAGSKAAEKAEKYVRSMNVNSGRYVDLYNSWATGGKFAKARVVN